MLRPTASTNYVPSNFHLTTIFSLKHKQHKKIFNEKKKNDKPVSTT